MLCIKFASLFWSLNQKQWRRNYEIQSSFPLWWLGVNPYRTLVLSKMGGKEPTFVPLFLSKYISDQTVDLLSLILERFLCLWLKAVTSLIGTIGMVKDMSKFSLRRGIQRGCQGVIFHDSITRYVLFTEKGVLCCRCKPQHILGENCPYSYTHPQNFWYVFDWAGWHSSLGESNFSATWTFFCDSP